MAFPFNVQEPRRDFAAVLSYRMTILIDHCDPLLIVNGHNRYRARVGNIFAGKRLISISHREGVPLNIPDCTLKDCCLMLNCHNPVGVVYVLLAHECEVSKRSLACSRAELESACPASMRASSEMRSSPTNSLTSEVVTPAARK